jgi:hypothetical protein
MRTLQKLLSAHDRIPVPWIALCEPGREIVQPAEHPGAELNRQYQAFTNLGKRDDWYGDLDRRDRWDLIEFRAELRKRCNE